MLLNILCLAGSVALLWENVLDLDRKLCVFIFIIRNFTVVFTDLRLYWKTNNNEK